MKSKHFIILSAGIVVAVGAFSAWLAVTVPKADKRITSVVSEDKHFRAVRVSVAGGGSKPFCYDSISVMLAVYPEMFAEKGKNYEVFNAPCDADRANMPKIEWVSDKEVRIIFRPTGAADPRKRRIDITNTVKILFNELK
ncbi:MAG: hypothetical protein ACK4UO_02600 [Pseudolabrys sp.]